MGQKVDPRIFRTSPGLNKNWHSVFYNFRDYAKIIGEDIKIRSFILNKYKNAEISKVLIERSLSKKIVVNIQVRKPGVIIGKSAKDIDVLKKHIMSITNIEVYINVHKVKVPETDAQIVSLLVAEQLEKRISFRKAMKRAMQSAMKNGAKGIKISCSGRLGGVEIARTEWYNEGRVPLHTLRANIDFAKSRACTTYGVIGVKTWIYKGDSHDKKM